MGEPILLSKREAARSLSISIRMLDKLIASKRISVRKIGRRVLIAPQWLQQFALGQDQRSRTTAKKQVD